MGLRYNTARADHSCGARKTTTKASRSGLERRSRWFYSGFYQRKLGRRNTPIQ